MTPRKQKKATPSMNGWEFRELNVNLWLKCSICGNRANEFFYKHTRPVNAPNLIETEILCLKCSQAKVLIS